MTLLLFSERGPRKRASFLLPSRGAGPAAAARCPHGRVLPPRRAPRLEAGRGGGVPPAACRCPHGRAASRACQKLPICCRRKKALDKKGAGW